jgi:rod shape-determining protein MreC
MGRATESNRWRLLGPLCLLATACLVGLWLDARQRGAVDRGETTRLEEVVSGIVVPWQQTLVNAAGLVQPSRPGDRSATRPANADLALREQARENERLRKLLGLRPPPDFGRIAATIIGREGWPWPSALVLDKGRREGLSARCAAVAVGRKGEGLVGQVISARRTSAVVFPLAEEGGGVAALVERSRETGIVEGMGAGRCALRYLPGGADVKPGDKVLSSGQGPVFPKGLPIGMVTAVRTEPQTGLKAADLNLFVDAHTVEEVIVLVPRKVAGGGTDR